MLWDTIPYGPLREMARRMEEADQVAIAFAVLAALDQDGRYALELNRLSIDNQSNLVLYKITHPENLMEIVLLERRGYPDPIYFIIDFTTPSRSLVLDDGIRISRPTRGELDIYLFARFLRRL